jgi:hypothetical protein
MHKEGASQEFLATRANAQSLMGDRSCGVVEATMSKGKKRGGTGKGRLNRLFGSGKGGR